MHTDTIVNDLATDVDYSRMFLPMFTVYEHPQDYPEHYVIRVFDGKGPVATNFVKLCRSLPDVRKAIPPCCYPLGRRTEDPPYIIDTYV